MTNPFGRLWAEWRGHWLAYRAPLPLRPVLETMVTRPGSEILSADQSAVLLGLTLRQPPRVNIRASAQRAARQGQTSAVLCATIAQAWKNDLPGKLGPVVLVGMDDPDWLRGYDNHKICSGSAAQLLDLFDTVHDFNPARQQPRLTLAHVREKSLTSSCDLVITGNVLNDFIRMSPKDNMWDACHALLKPGGYALHMLAYSRDGYEDIFGQLHGNKTLQLFATLTASAQTGRQGNYHFIVIRKMP